MRLDYTFAERLAVPAHSVEDAIKQLKEDYYFDVNYEGEDRVNFGYKVSFPQGYSGVKKDWVLEVIEYHKPAGVAIIVEERL